MKKLLEIVLPASVLGLWAVPSVFGQAQFHYTGTNATGQVVLTQTVTISATNQPAAQAHALSRIMHSEAMNELAVGASLPDAKYLPKLLPPPPAFRAFAALPLAVTVQSLPVVPSSALGFPGITHANQRNANNGNQFSVEPPNVSLAVSDHYILEGVNNAIFVYSLTGTPLLPMVLSSNQVFGVPAAIDRNTGVNGVFPTDMRVFYDRDIDRFFVIQRVQANDAAGNPLPKSNIYIAVSQTGDPTKAYNVYNIDTTQIGRPGCPCLADFPEVGSDATGLYLTWTDYQLFADGSNSQFPLGASIIGISKTGIGSGAATPTAFQFVLPSKSGFEFAIAPASVPPGASNFVGSGGLEYFVSSIATGDSNLSLWAMTNTSSLATANPNPLLTRTPITTTLSYGPPNDAVQRNGPLPYGSSLAPPGKLAFLDGADSRVLSLVYSGGRLFLALGSSVTDENGQRLSGGAYFILSPTYRANLLGATVLNQGFLVTKGNNLLRPSIAVNPQGRGAVALTLVGPDYYPSAAFVPISMTGLGSAIQLAAPGVSPEDGFTGYPGGGVQGTARWGDYSAATAASDGSIWMAMEFIPNAPRTVFANWGTWVAQYIP
jgi:hypothetical protein